MFNSYIADGLCQETREPKKAGEKDRNRSTLRRCAFEVRWAAKDTETMFHQRPRKLRCRAIEPRLRSLPKLDGIKVMVL